MGPRVWGRSLEEAIHQYEEAKIAEYSFQTFQKGESSKSSTGSSYVHDCTPPPSQKSKLEDDIDISEECEMTVHAEETKDSSIISSKDQILARILELTTETHQVVVLEQQHKLQQQKDSSKSHKKIPIIEHDFEC